MINYLFALDLGKQNDPCSLQVWRATVLKEPSIAYSSRKDIIQYRDVLILQKQYLKIRYTDIVEQIVEMLNHPLFVNQSHLVFDSTGVGQAVKDMFYSLGLYTFTAINYTSGTKVNYVYREENSRFSNTWSNSLKILDQVNVPKADLVTAAKASLEMQEVQIPTIVNGKEIPFIKVFKKQMEEFTGKMGARGYVKYNNSSDDIHDDWVNCFMLRSWWRREFEGKLRREVQNVGEVKKEEFANIIGGLNDK